MADLGSPATYGAMTALSALPGAKSRLRMPVACRVRAASVIQRSRSLVSTEPDRRRCVRCESLLVARLRETLLTFFGVPLARLAIFANHFGRLAGAIHLHLLQLERWGGGG